MENAKENPGNLSHHLLPTEDASPLILIGDWKKLVVDTKGDMTIKDLSKDESFQHIYLCSSGKIKEGDWCIRTDWSTHKIGEGINKCTRIDTYTDSIKSFGFFNGTCKSTDYYFDNSLVSSEDTYLKIILTTDPKLWDKYTLSLGQTETIKGVLPIDRNTRAEIHYGKDYPFDKIDEAGFLYEFCKRWNTNKGWEEFDFPDGEKGVVEKQVEDLLNDSIEESSSLSAKDFAKIIHKKYNQSQNTGRFSLEDMINCWNASEQNSVMREHTQTSFTAEDYIQSLTPQPKGDIVIEVEMEEEYEYITSNQQKVFVGYKIKLTDGKPTLIFK